MVEDSDLGMAGALLQGFGWVEDLVVVGVDGDNHCSALCGILKVHNNVEQPGFFGKQSKMVVSEERQVVFSLI